MALFNTAVNIVLKHEGGYVKNPSDPGGETKYGISKNQYPFEDIENLTVERARQIYFSDYWIANQLDKINDQKVANFALDTVVNHGQGVRIIQKALNASGKNVSVDNSIGTETLRALNSVEPGTFIRNGVQERKSYYLGLIQEHPSLSQFKSGWWKRLNSFSGGLSYTNIGIGTAVVIAGLYFLMRYTKF